MSCRLPKQNIAERIILAYTACRYTEPGGWYTYHYCSYSGWYIDICFQLHVVRVGKVVTFHSKFYTFVYNWKQIIGNIPLFPIRSALPSTEIRHRSVLTQISRESWNSIYSANHIAKHPFLKLRILKKVQFIWQALGLGSSFGGLSGGWTWHESPDWDAGM